MTETETKTTSDANVATASVEASNEIRIINGRRCKHVDAYVTANGKSIAAHWRPIRACRSWAATSGTPLVQSPIANGLALDAASEAQQAPSATPSVEETLAAAAQQGAATRAAQRSHASAATIAAPTVTCNVPSVANYVPANGELDVVNSALDAGVNVLLTGPTGCGKTHLALYVAQERKQGLITIQGGAGSTYERIIAKDTLCEVNGVTVTSRQLGVLLQAMEQGALCYVDEPNAIPSEVLFYLFSAMDDRREVTLDDGSVVKARTGFNVILAMNEGSGYAGTAMLNAAFRQRCIVEDMQYLSQERESSVLVQRCNVSKEIADNLTKAAQSARNSVAGKNVKTPIGTRALMFAAKLIASGMKPAKAVQVSIVNQVPSQFPIDRKAISDLFAAHFGASVA